MPKSASPSRSEIEILVRQGNARDEAVLELDAPGRLNREEFGPFRLALLERVVDELYHDFETPSPDLQHRLERAGAYLADILPAPFLKALTELASEEPKTLLIQSHEPWIPWEALWLPTGREGSRRTGRFLCEVFAVSRWLKGVRWVDRLPLTEVALVASTSSKLLGVEEERRSLERLAEHGYSLERIPAERDAVLEALGMNRFDGWHFSGHGFLSESDPNRSKIELQRGEDLIAHDLNRYDFEDRPPLVFWNACHTGRSGESPTGIGGWAERFVRKGAGAFLGPHWQVHDMQAARFSEAFYTAFLSGRPIARAVWEARRAIRSDDDATWLAYTLFAHPETRREAPVAEERSAEPRPQSAPSPPEPSRGSPSVQENPREEWLSRRVRPLAVAGALLLVLGLVLAALWLTSAEAPPRVAVLDLVEAPEPETWRATLLAEMVDTCLAAEPGIRTIDREHVAEVERALLRRPPASDAKERGHWSASLGADYLVRGRFEEPSAAGRLEVRWRLEDVETGELRGEISSSGARDDLATLACEAAASLREELGVDPPESLSSSRIEALYPSDPKALRALARGLAESRRFKTAAARLELDKAFEISGGHPIVGFELAKALLDLEEYDRAAEVLEIAREGSAELSPEWRLRIEAALANARGEWAEEAELYRRLHRAYPENIEYGLRQAQSLGWNGQAVDAFRVLDELREDAEEKRNRARIDLAAAHLHLDVGDSRASLALARRAARLAEDAGASTFAMEALFHQSITHGAAGDSDEAIETLRKAEARLQYVNLTREFFLTCETRAYSLVTSNALQPAREAYEFCLEAARSSGNEESEARVLVRLLPVLIDLGQTEEAETLAESSLPRADFLTPSLEATVYLNLGVMYHQQGRLEDAWSRYLEAAGLYLQIDHLENFGLSLTNLGELLFLGGRFDAARRMYEAALLHQGLEGELSTYEGFRLAEVFLAQGQIDEARRAFEAAENLELAGRNRGEFLLGLARAEIAEADFGQAIERAQEARKLFLDVEEPGFALRAKILRFRALLASSDDIPRHQALAEDLFVQLNLTPCPDPHTCLAAALAEVAWSSSRDEPVEIDAVIEAAEVAAEAGLGAALDEALTAWREVWRRAEKEPPGEVETRLEALLATTRAAWEPRARQGLELLAEASEVSDRPGS